MARIFFAWELGGGLGHIAPHLALIDGLLAHGHQVSFAMRNSTAAEGMFAQRDVQCLQAPIHQGAAADPIQTPLTYAHILHNCGYEDPEKLLGLVRAWRSLYDLVRPDVAIFDHAPTAILASGGYPFRRIGLGIGFYTPPDIYPLPNLRPYVQVSAEELRADEDRTLAIMNRVLDRLRLTPLERISCLFRLDAQIFRTYLELDHYRERGNAEYLGLLPSPSGEAPRWPGGDGPRVFAYLKGLGAREVLNALKAAQQPTLVFIHGLRPEAKHEFAAPHMHFSDRPLDIAAVAESCGVALLNGTHDTTAQLLLAGVPSINLPLHLEQSIVATRITELGAGIHFGAARAELVRQALTSMSTSDRFHRSAADFAARYRVPDSAARLDHLLNRIDGLAGMT
jgi:UDP:flavonoid glycosyltransferase YjiC (YdhE family)